MKRLFIGIMIFTVLAGVGCQSNNENINNNDNYTVNSIKDNNEEAENNKEEQGIINRQDKFEGITLNLGELKNCNDIIELQFDSSQWMDSILPSNTSSVYSYYEDIEGESYFVLKGTVKNISSETVDIKFEARE